MPSCVNPVNVAQLGRAPERVAVAVADAVPLVDEVEVRVDMDDVDGLLIVEGPDAGDVHGMIAAERHRQGTGGENLAHGHIRCWRAMRSVSVWTMSASPMSDDAHAIACGQIRDVVLEVIHAGVAEREQRRRFADGAWPKTRPGPVLRPHIERRAEHADIRILQRSPSPAPRRAAWRNVQWADKRQVEAAFLVAVLGSWNDCPLYRGPCGASPC